MHELARAGWKDYWFFYASIGAEVDVFHRELTRDTWGNTKTDWVKRPALISIVNTYQGNIDGNVPPPPGKSPRPSDAGQGTFVQTAEFNSNHGELRLWATGFFTTTISVNGEQ